MRTMKEIFISFQNPFFSWLDNCHFHKIQSPTAAGIIDFCSAYIHSVIPCIHSNISKRHQIKIIVVAWGNHIIVNLCCSNLIFNTIYFDSRTSVCIITGQRQEQLYCIISFFLHIYRIMKIISFVNCIIDSIDPADHLKFTYVFSLCNTKICIWNNIFYICHSGIGTRRHWRSFIFWRISGCLQIIKQGFGINRNLRYLAYQISASDIITSDIHIQSFIAKKESGCFRSQCLIIPEPVRPPAKGGPPSLKLTHTIIIGIMKYRGCLRLEFYYLICICRFHITFTYRKCGYAQRSDCNCCNFSF